jgi:ABC-type multidrug transport system fused ATPase/permease subunit
MNLVLQPLANLNATAAFALSSLAAAERLQDFVEVSEANRSANFHKSDYRDENETATTTSFPGNPLLAAKDAMIRVKSKEDPILADVNFSISRGSFTVIAGKVGSGKSVLIRALLGHTPSSGSILRQVSNVAYCAQSTWLVNATAKQNIMGQSEWDAEWYETVIKACALDQDFEQLPDGDSVLVGSKGQALSGGQKQRIVSEAARSGFGFYY